MEIIDFAKANNRADKLNMDIANSNLTLGEALQLALQYHQTGRLEEAETLYRQVLGAMPKQPDALHLLGLLHSDKKEYAPAEDLIRQAIEINPSAAEFHNNLGVVYQEQTKLDQSVTCFKRAIELKPAYPEAWNNLGHSFFVQGLDKEAIAAFEEALRQQPAYAKAWNNLGAVHARRNDFGTAEVCFRKALVFMPGHISAQQNLDATVALEGVMELLSMMIPQIPEGEMEFRSAVEVAMKSGRDGILDLYQRRYDFYRLGLDKNFQQILDLACRHDPALYYSCRYDDPSPCYRHDAVPSSAMPSILLVTMYKSGTDYMSSKICPALGIPLVRILSGDWPTDIIPSWLAHFLKFGGLCVQHLHPSDNNIQILLEGGVKKLQVHVRDPRQAFLSAFHFEEKIIEEKGTAAKAILDSLPSGYFGMSRSERLDTRIHGGLGEYFAKFAMDWVDARMRYKKHLEVRMSTYESMVKDEIEFSRQFSDFFGLDAGFFERYSQAAGSRHHFRKGRTDEWKEVLSSAQCDFLMQGVTLEISREFGWIL